jgi:hypothetical protein
MIGMGFWFNAILRVGPLMSSNTGAAQAISRFRWYANAMAVCGVLVLFFTALAQVELTMPAKIIYHRMKNLNIRMAANYKRGFGPTRIVLLLTTTGRKSGLPRVTPLQ